MSMLAVCVILAVAGQGWDKPVIQEAELAPPAGISEGQAVSAPSTQPAPSRDMESASPVEEPASEAPRDLQWEYDDDGQPVARPMNTPEASKPAEPEQTPKAAPAVKSQQKKEQSLPVSRGSRHVATFWFVLPK